MKKNILSSETQEFVPKQDGGLEIIQKYQYTRYTVEGDANVWADNDTLDWGFRFKSEKKIHWGYQSHANAIACAHIYANEQLKLLSRMEKV